LVACAAAPESSTNGAESSRPVGTRSFVTLVPRSEVWLVVVDDTPIAQGLREALADRFDDYDEEKLGSGCDGVPDPARWSPIDRSLVLVRPSQVGAGRFESPATVPALRWQASHVTSDDQSASLAPSAYALPDWGNSATFFYSLIVGANSTCTAPTPRLGNWAAMERDELASKVQIWPCEAPLEPLWDFFCDGVETGIPADEVKFDANGFAECSVTSVVPADEACPAEYGWLDPIGADGTRSPKLSSTAAGMVRACEIEQLTGGALASCRTSYGCADCAPGWCFTDVPELTSDSIGMTMRWPLGADLGNPSAERTLRCQSPH
jgi:hypothetical protein